MAPIEPTGGAPPAVPDPGAPPAAAPAPAPPRAPPPRPRLHFVDWLRLALTALVVVHHAVCLYFSPPLNVPQTGLGVVFFIKYPPAPIPPAANWFLSANQSYFMGLFFLLSGLFTTGSYNRKGALGFITDRALRLVLPLLAWDFVLMPLTFCATFLGQQDFLQDTYIKPNPIPTTFAGVWQLYFQHYYTALGRNQMWFVLTLFLFDLAYVLFRLAAAGCARAAPGACGDWPARVSTKAAGALPTTQAGAGAGAAGAAGTAEHMTSGPYYSTRATAGALAFIWLWVAGWMCLSIQQNAGESFTSYIMQLPVKYAPQYVSAYILGIALDLRGALPRLPRRLAYACVVITALIAGVLLPELEIAPASSALAEFTPSGAPRLAIVYTRVFVEQLYVVCWCYALLALGRIYFNAKPGRFGALLIGAASQLAWPIYIIHPTVIGLYGRAFESVAWPTVGVFIFATPLILVSSWIIAIAAKAIPGASRIL